MPGNDGGLSFAEKIKTLQFATGRSRPVRREPLDDSGRRTKVVTELTESGCIATTRNRTSDRGEHQDVHIQAPLLTGKGVVTQ
ncbi:hypothetical protein ACFYUV_38085 [Nonomuraea sp. NPDC003560]|uniref:hypothetical protein n=1 Tax=Nonomuraea sp. NPDC003560 TaxID=3364341 RepID=UPI0036B4BE10